MAEPTADLAAPTARTQRREIRRVVASSFLGSAIEFYDFLLYASAASLVFGPVFFANLDPLTAMIASYGTFAAGYLARPIGGVIFGHFGDRLGRRRMLVISMTMMGVASFVIGLLPTPEMIGPWAAILLVALRVIQGFAVGGEWGGAALMSLEHAEKKHRGFAASFTNAGAPTGVLLGTSAMGVAAMLPEEQFLSWGWRVPFLLSFLLLVTGLFIRAKVTESPVFLAAMEKAEAHKHNAAPIVEVLRRPKKIVLVTLSCAALFGMQSMLSTFAVTYAVDQGADRSTPLFAMSLSSIVSIGTVLLYGKLSDRFGRRNMMVSGFLSFALLIYPIMSWLGSTNALLIFLAFLVAKLCYSAAYGPMAAFVSEQFGPRTRYTGASLSYQLATLIGAGFTPVVLATLFAAGDATVIPVVAFLIGFSTVSIICLFLTGETKNNDIDNDNL